MTKIEAAILLGTYAAAKHEVRRMCGELSLSDTALAGAVETLALLCVEAVDVLVSEALEKG